MYCYLISLHAVKALTVHGGYIVYNANGQRSAVIRIKEFYSKYSISSQDWILRDCVFSGGV